MATIDKIDISGAAAGTADVPDALVQAECPEHVIHQCMVAERACRRAGTAHTKTKGEVRASGSKPWRQKGTGRARAGQVSSPLWRGGSVVFGPRSRSYNKKVSRQLRRTALRAVLAEKVRDGAVCLIDSWEMETPRTRAIDGLRTEKGGRKLLCVGDATARNARLSARNHPAVSFVDSSEVTVYKLLLHDAVIISAEAWKTLLARLLTEESTQEAV